MENIEGTCQMMRCTWTIRIIKKLNKSEKEENGYSSKVPLLDDDQEVINYKIKFDFLFCLIFWLIDILFVNNNLTYFAGIS